MGFFWIYCMVLSYDDLIAILDNSLSISVLAGVIVLIGDTLRRRLVNKRKYGKAAGKYECYSFIKGTEELYKNECFATIAYKGNNVLKIKHYDPNRGDEWEGEILMELESKCAVAFRYTKLKKKEQMFNDIHRFGMKHCIVRKDMIEKKMYVYLIGEKWIEEINGDLKVEGFGNEVLTRDLKKKELRN